MVRTSMLLLEVWKITLIWQGQQTGLEGILKDPSALWSHSWLSLSDLSLNSPVCNLNVLAEWAIRETSCKTSLLFDDCCCVSLSLGRVKQTQFSQALLSEGVFKPLIVPAALSCPADSFLPGSLVIKLPTVLQPQAVACWGLLQMPCVWHLHHTPL